MIAAPPDREDTEVQGEPKRSRTRKKMYSLVVVLPCPNEYAELSQPRGSSLLCLQGYYRKALRHHCRSFLSPGGTLTVLASNEGNLPNHRKRKALCQCVACRFDEGRDALGIYARVSKLLHPPPRNGQYVSPQYTIAWQFRLRKLILPFVSLTAYSRGLFAHPPLELTGARVNQASPN